MMPISGKEETGGFDWQSSNYSAGVPIKKRKFPLVRLPSPSPQEPPGLSLMGSKSSSPSQETSLSNADVGASNANKNPILEIKKEITADTDVNLAGVNFNHSIGESETPSTNHLDSQDVVDSNDKSLLSSQQNMIKLDLAPNEFPPEHVGNKVPCTLQVRRDCAPEPFGVVENIELSLGTREPPISALTTSQSSNDISQIMDIVDPSLLCLSVSKDKYVSRCESRDPKVNCDSSHVHANRANWDLNTTMDAWEAPVGDDVGSEIVGLTGTESGLAHGMEPLISSTAGHGVISDAGEQNFGAAERISNFSRLSLPPSGQCRSEDPLHLSLSTFTQANASVENLNLSVEIDSGTVQSNPKIVEGLIPFGNKNSFGCDTIKSEPFDDSLKHNGLVTSASPMELLGGFCKGLEDCSMKSVSGLKVRPDNTMEPRPIKSEPVREGNEERQVILHKPAEKVVPCQDNISLSLAMSLKLSESCPSSSLACSELTVSGDATNQLEDSTCRKDARVDTDTVQVSPKIVDQVAAGIVLASPSDKSKESDISEGMIDTCIPKDANCDDPERWTLEAKDCNPQYSSRNNDGAESDEEKVNILAEILEEDSDGFEYESDGNHGVVGRVNSEGRHDDREDDEYEDGEVREALAHTAAEAPMQCREEEKISCSDCDVKISEALDPQSDGITAQALNINDDKGEHCGDIGDDHNEGCAEAVPLKDADQVLDRDYSLQESSTVEEGAAEADEKRTIKCSERRSPDISGRTNQKCHDAEELSDGATNGRQCVDTTVGQTRNTNIERTEIVEKVDPSLGKTELFLNDKEAAKDGNTGGSRSRIINLPRATNVTSPSRPRFGSDLSTGRERHADFEGERIHLQRNRSSFYADGPRKFERDRFQDQPFRNSRTNFVRGRGRGFRQHGEWDSDRNFGGDIYNDTGDYRFPRQKRVSGDAELGYGINTNSALGMGRGGRKPVSDELHSFRHPSSRRLSPGVRDDAGTRGIQMARRYPGNVSPSRCTNEHGSELLRHGEKFMRGLREDVANPIFSRQQPKNEDGHFVGGNRNYSTVQRRGFPRTRSKSPVRSRTRSPGPWSSPRRRSPDSFSGLPELTHRGSATIYRMERIRSPDHPSFAEEIVGRRCSPPYVGRLSDDLRNMDSGRVVQSRPTNPNRRPFDRGLPRGTRRFDNIDPRGRTDGDEYFRGPVRSGRYQEIGGEGRDDDRRKCGDRRGLVRSFRPPYNGVDGENMRFHEDGPLRFRSEGGSEFIERGNMREREFDRKIKYKPGGEPSRVRSLEEEEGNYRQGGQVWHDDGFDGGPHMKRRKF